MTLELVKPKPDAEEEPYLHFSFSQLNTYLICPMKYAFNYVWGTPPESKPIALVFGKSVHKGAERFYKALMDTGEALPLDAVIDAFTASYDREIEATEVELTFKKGETKGTVREQGIELMKVFHQEVQPQNIAAVEFPFSVSIPDLLNGEEYLPIKLVGYFDLIESDAQNTYLVAELKTSAQRFSSLRLEYDLQATTYAYAMTKLRLSSPEGSCLVRYDVLLKTKKPGLEQYFVTRTAADSARLIHLINHVLKAIEGRIFYRQTGWQCGDCQFKKACFS